MIFCSTIVTLILLDNQLNANISVSNIMTEHKELEREIQFAQKFNNYFAPFLLNKAESDVEIKCNDNTVYPAHKIILTSRR